MSALASNNVWQQAFKVVSDLFAPVEAPVVRDPWAGRRFTIIRRIGDAVDVRDASGRAETIALSFGARQTIDAFVAAIGRKDAVGLTLVRESFCLEGVAVLALGRRRLTPSGSRRCRFAWPDDVRRPGVGAPVAATKAPTHPGQTC